MKHSKLSLNLVVCYALVLSLSACSNEDEIGKPKSPSQPNIEANKHPSPTPSQQTLAAKHAPNEDVYQTPSGTFVIRHTDDSTNTPGKLFLNGKLIYTARSEEPLPQRRGRPFDLRSIDLWDTSDKKYPNFLINRMVVMEKSQSCRYIVIDFTGPKVWISNRFPSEGTDQGECDEITWIRWGKKQSYFYFGYDASLWDKDGYHGWVEEYDSKLKEISGTNPDFREAGEPTCEDN
jgi:hypothetical protein